jgi:hypothetical protein
VSRRELRPGAFNSSIRPPVHHQSTDFSSAPANFIFSGEPPPLLHLGFFSFLHFPVCAEGPLPSLTSPIGGAPSPFSPPGAARPPARPLHTHARLALPSGRHGPLRRRPPTPCAQPSPYAPPPLSLPCHGERRRRRKKMEIL